MKDEEIHDATTYALESLLKAQYPNGGWPQRYPASPPSKIRTFDVKKIGLDGKVTIIKAPRSYSHYYTFNDNAMNDCISVMLEAHQRYGDEKYLRSAERGGDFMIASQLPAPQAGWAQQYNLDMKPEWARKFEPPSVNGAVTARNIRTLISLYLETGKEKYLKPIPAAIDWLERSKIGPNLWARFYELGTNRPLYFTKDKYELVYADDNLPTHYSFKGGYGVRKAIALYERLMKEGRETLLAERKAKPSSELIRRRAEASESKVRGIIAALDDQGRWVKGHTIHTSVFITNMAHLGDYVAAARLR